jgi:hypothetical protein
VFRLLVDRAEGGAWSGGKCRALYGVDVLFATSPAWQADGGHANGAASSAAVGHLEGGALADAQPVVLEVNYSPDYGQMLAHHPAFLDDAFTRLFVADADAAPDEAAMRDWEAVPV